MTVNMKIDLVGKSQRGLALGLNEFAGYVAVAVVGFLTGYLASTLGLKPYPFYLGIIFAILDLAISWIIVKDTRRFTSLEIKEHVSESLKEGTSAKDLSFKEVFLHTSWKNRTLLAISQAGLINNLIFGVTWGLFTLYFASFAIGISEIGFLKALHPGIWGVLQLLTGTFSDKVGRKVLIYPGMIIQGIGVWVVLFTNFYWGWIIGMCLLGIGTAMVYPTLLAAISDVANPKWRATSLGVYRFWRDLGFVFGAIGIGFLADIFGLTTAFHIVALLGIVSGIFVLAVMKETNRQG
ncbi:MAG TPA: MFS transporter [Nitrososphaeraceae archaeon]|nr:MFS transporter [Nitrososphaeraceae archaeon]